MKRFAAVLLVLALAFGCAGTASAAKPVVPPERSRMFPGWCYVPSTLPDGFHERFAGGAAGMHYKMKWYEPDKWDVTLISGDEWLDGAVKLEVIPIASGERFVEMMIDNSVLTRPGHAVFRIVVEYPAFITETEEELWVLSWDEHPLMEWLEEPVEYTISVGQTLSSEQMVSCVAVDHKEEIAQMLNEQSGHKLYKICGGGFSFPGEETMRSEQVRVIKSGSAPDELVSYTFGKAGRFEIPVNVWYGNTEGEYRTVVVNVLPYYLTGPAGVRPGETACYAVTDTDQAAGRTFALSLEGEGLAFNAETGEITAPADAAIGTAYTVTAVPSDGGKAVTLQGTVGTGLLCGTAIGTMGLENGFGVPFPSLGESGRDWGSGRFYSQTQAGAGAEQIVYDVRLNGRDDYAEDPEKAAAGYDAYVNALDKLEVLESRDIDVDGYPARAVVGRIGDSSAGYLLYTRSNQDMEARLFSSPLNGTSRDNLEKVTMADMEKLAAAITYDASAAEIRPEDVALTLAAKDGAAVLTAGKTLQLTASFASPEKLKLLNKKYKPEEITWSVADAETGEAPEGVTVDAKGVLKADKALAAAKKVTVTVYSPVFGSSASAEVTVIPAAKGITAEPAEVFFYTGTDTPRTVTAVLDPDTVPPVGLQWKAQKDGIVEVTPGEDGTAGLRPLAPGKISLTVTEPGGKKAQVRVNVTDPVTGLELTVSGRAKPGGSVTVKEILAPKTAGNKNVAWSLDVGEDIATISKGKVKISKDAPAGTVITVTCTAEGAPEPVSATAQITVE